MTNIEQLKDLTYHKARELLDELSMAFDHRRQTKPDGNEVENMARVRDLQNEMTRANSFSAAGMTRHTMASHLVSNFYFYRHNVFVSVAV